MTYFPYKTTTKIVGKPTHTILALLQKQLKANTGTITSVPGGGVHGHLDAILSAEDYANLSNTPYNKPFYADPLVTPTSAAHHDAIRLQEEHNEKIITFCKVLYEENILYYIP